MQLLRLEIFLNERVSCIYLDITSKHNIQFKQNIRYYYGMSETLYVYKDILIAVTY